MKPRSKNNCALVPITTRVTILFYFVPDVETSLDGIFFLKFVCFHEKRKLIPLQPISTVQTEKEVVFVCFNIILKKKNYIN